MGIVNFKGKSNTLVFFEWAAIVALIAFILCLTFYTQLRSSNSKIVTTHSTSTIEVHIEGAVRNPGWYEVQRGTVVETLIAKAELLPNAQCQKKIMRRVLEPNETIFIPKAKDISIKITGAVDNPGWITVKEGTRICDLKELVKLKEKAKVSVLSKKSRVRPSEEIFIPFKKK